MYETVAKHAESERYLLIMNVVNPGRCCREECRNAFQPCSQKTVFTQKKTSPPTKRFPRVSAAFAIEKLIRAVSGLDSVPIRRLFFTSFNVTYAVGYVERTISKSFSMHRFRLGRVRTLDQE